MSWFVKKIYILEAPPSMVKEIERLNGIISKQHNEFINLEYNNKLAWDHLEIARDQLKRAVERYETILRSRLLKKEAK